jgi:predicted N-acetyltransferase YhbS
LLGPIAVHPTRQGEGLGALMIKESVSHAKELDYSRIILIGDFSYYGRLGFKKLTNIKMPKPTNPDRILGIELISGAWDMPSGSIKSSN